MDQGRNRVFINPNFNKGLKNSGAMRPMCLMHVNPSFSAHVQNIQPMPKAKIYINPNFVKRNEIRSQDSNMNAHYSFERTNQLIDNSDKLTPRVSTVVKHESIGYTTVPMQSASVQPYQTKSRYSYVRHKGTELPRPIVPNTQTHTVKISKYKSINITDIKKNLDSVKPLRKSISTKLVNNPSILQTKNDKIVYSNDSNTRENKYKLVRPSADVNKPRFKRQISSNSKKVVCSRTRIKAIGVYKKNNIPCPQFRKYGKCLRKLQEKCEFLHDKKHVSICRKFLTGVCHDEKCLLSHELSDKKMPTCYFYLKGMCTKEGCPYLHVKLNDKAKICSDFIRGYCDKGDECLKRHVTKSSAIDVKQRHSLEKQSLQKSTKYKIEKNKLKMNINSSQRRETKIRSNDQPPSQGNEDSSCRYYKESIQEVGFSESLEAIKPSRCKLGTLPSFIQL